MGAASSLCSDRAIRVGVLISVSVGVLDSHKREHTSCVRRCGGYALFYRRQVLEAEVRIFLSAENRRNLVEVHFTVSCLRACFFFGA